MNFWQPDVLSTSPALMLDGAENLAARFLEQSEANSLIPNRRAERCAYAGAHARARTHTHTHTHTHTRTG